MMKSYILTALALSASLISFLYEAPEASNTFKATDLPSSSAALNPLLTVADLPSPTPADLAKEAKENDLTYKDSLFYSYYAQSLGLKLEYKEDKELLETVSEWIGTPYRAGGTSRRGADCSGFVTRVYKTVYGITLSRSSRSMFHDVDRVAKSELETGDLVFFRRGPGKPIYHVGIYLKDGKFIHSASNGGVMINSLRSPYYKKNFYAGGRAI